MTWKDLLSQIYVEKLPIAFTFWFSSQTSFPKQYSQRERTLNIYDCSESKRNISCVLHLKGVQSSSVSQNVDNFSNHRANGPCPKKGCDSPENNMVCIY